MQKLRWQNLTNAFNELTGRFCFWLDSLDEQTRYFHLFMMMGLTVLMLSLSACHFRISQDMDQYETANLQLAQAIQNRQQELESFQLQEKQHTETLAQLSALKKLQEKVQAPVTVLLELANIIPSNVCINRFLQHGQKLSFVGKSKSHPEIAKFLQNLAESRVFHDPVLINLKQSASKSEGSEDFELAVKWMVTGKEVVG